MFDSFGVGLALPQLGGHITRDAVRAFCERAEALGTDVRGRSLVRDVVEELQPDSARMDDAAALAETQERPQ